MTDTVFGASETNLSDYPAAVDDLDDGTPGDDDAFVEEPGSDVSDTNEPDKDDSSSKGTGRGITRAQIRRIASKAQEVVDTEARIREIAGHLVGSGTGVAELTTAIMSAERGVTQPIGDLNTIAEADPMEAGVLAGALGRARLKNVWALLAALNAGPKGNIPAADAKAAIAVARAVFGLDEIAKAELDAVVTLLRKN